MALRPGTILCIDKVNDRSRAGNPKSIKVASKLLDFVASGDADIGEKLCSSGGVIGDDFQPQLGLTHPRDFVDPEIIFAELKADSISGGPPDLFKTQQIAVEPDGRIMLMWRNLHRDVFATLKFCGHIHSPTWL